MPFQTLKVLCETEDFRNFDLRSFIVFESRKHQCLYRAPIGGKTDLISTPPPIWIKLAPFGQLIRGKWRGAKSGVIHDMAYHDTLEVSYDVGITWQRIKLDQKQSDELILECLEDEGLSTIEALEVYEALRLFGKKAFDEDRAAEEAKL